jgi:hypothetical protein
MIMHPLQLVIGSFVAPYFAKSIAMKDNIEDSP